MHTQSSDQVSSFEIRVVKLFSPEICINKCVKEKKKENFLHQSRQFAVIFVLEKKKRRKRFFFRRKTEEEEDT